MRAATRELLMRPASFSARLRRRITAVVAMLALLISTGTIVAAGAIMYEQLDEQVNNARALRTCETGQQNGRLEGILAPDTPPGTTVVPRNSSGISVASRIGHGEYDNVSAEAIDALLKVNTNGQKRTVDIPGLGQYRAVVQYNRDHELTVLALPLETANITIMCLSLLTVALGVAAVVVAAFATRAVTNAATKPLRLLSATALTVSQLDLDRGEVDVPAVPDPALLPEHGVAQLTGAFNRMLGNVQGVLKARQTSETKLRRLVVDVSHELRDPLAAIHGHSGLAARGGGAGSAFVLGRIDSELQCITKPVEDFLLLTRLDTDAPVEMQPVDIVAVVLNAVNGARAAGPDHIQRLELPEEGLKAWADANHLHQVIASLLSNARNHIPAGATVTTVTGIKDGQACLMVVDDGPGIAPGVLPRTFERFTRADASRCHNEAKSTGLGLSIVQATVESFGGRAEVDSRPGHTYFTIWLPLAS